MNIFTYMVRDGQDLEEMQRGHFSGTSTSRASCFPPSQLPHGESLITCFCLQVWIHYSQILWLACLELVDSPWPLNSGWLDVYDNYPDFLTIIWLHLHLQYSSWFSTLCCQILTHLYYPWSATNAEKTMLPIVRVIKMIPKNILNKHFYL